MNDRIKADLNHFSGGRAIYGRLLDMLTGRPALLPALFALISVYLSYAFRSRFPAAVLLSAFIAGSVYIFFRKRIFGKECFILVFSAFLQICILLMTAGCFYQGKYPVFGDTSDITLDGYVRSVRYRTDGSVEAVINDRTYGRLLFRTSGEDHTRISSGSYVNGECVLVLPSAPVNPGEFDYPSYLLRQGIRGTIAGEPFFSKPQGILGITVSGISSFSYNVRSYVLSLFGDDRALASAVFMGDTSLLDDNDVRAVRLAGCSHLLAVSGTHFTGFLMLLPYALKRFKIPKVPSRILYALFCIFLGLLTGWSPSVTRAAVMSFCAFCFRDRISAMALSVCLLTAADPFSLLSTGFLMSFSSALSMIFFAPVIEEKIKIRSLSYTLAAIFGMMPFWADAGSYISPSSVLIQMLSSFIAQIACIFFTPSVILAFLFGDYMTLIAVWPLKLMLSILRAYSAVAMYSPNSRDMGIFLIVSVYIFMFIRMFPFPLMKRWLTVPAALLLALSVGTAFGSCITRPEAEAVFIDVGQGDCCLIKSGGFSVLIDGGTYEEGRENVSTVLDYYSLPYVDVAFLSHWDNDHAGGIAYLYQQGRIGRIFAPDPPDTFNIEELCRATSVDYLPYEPLYSGLTVTLDDIEFTCISPDRECLTDGGNEDSLVLYARICNTTILFTGDIGTDTEEQLLRSSCLYDTDVLKVAHHGSRFSTCRSFLEAVDPEYSVISAGRRNAYGHPASETLERLSDFEVHCTAWEGAVFLDIYTDRLEVRGMVG